MRNEVLITYYLSAFGCCSKTVHLQPVPQVADDLFMRKSLVMRSPVRCAYVRDCYLGEAQECHGFKSDCPLYMKTNGETCNEADFHAAVDKLIVRTKTKHDLLGRRLVNRPVAAKSPKSSAAS